MIILEIDPLINWPNPHLPAPVGSAHNDNKNSPPITVFGCSHSQWEAPSQTLSCYPQREAWARPRGCRRETDLWAAASGLGCGLVGCATGQLGPGKEAKGKEVGNVGRKGQTDFTKRFLTPNKCSV